jgi:hypothetical protein
VVALLGDEMRIILLIILLVWKSWVRSTVISFSWKMLLDKALTLKNLSYHRIMSMCFCGLAQESSRHLFITCDVSIQIWCKVFHWFDWELAMLPELFHLFSVLCYFEVALSLSIT